MLKKEKKESKKLDKKDLLYINSPILDVCSLEECAKGVFKLLANSEDLLKSGKLLMKDDKFPQAAVFLIAALEELTKITHLETEAISNRQIDKKMRSKLTKQFHTNFKNHQRKQLHGVGTLLNSNLIDNANYEEAYEVAKELQPILEKIRQGGLYVSIKEGKFISPKENFEYHKFDQKVEYLYNKLLSIIKEKRTTLDDNPIQWIKLIRFARLTTLLIDKSSSLVEANERILKIMRSSSYKDLNFEDLLKNN